MAITYPLTLPTTKEPKRVRLYAINTVGISQSNFTHQAQVQQFEGQSWGADVTFPEMSRDEAEEYNAFLLALMGRTGTFFLEMPLSQQPRGQATGAPRVNGSDQRGNVVVTDGWTPNVTGILLAGDCVQISNGIHRVLQDVDSDGSGNATLDIWPRLQRGVVDDEVIVTEGCRGVFRLSQNVYPIADLDEQKLYSISFSCEEAK